jgi:putative hydrolase of the HAD superfamily
MVKDTTGFNVRLTKKMAERGITQADLCRLTGLASSMVSHYCTGQRVPSVPVAVKIARALNTTVDNLASDTPKHSRGTTAGALAVAEYGAQEQSYGSIDDEEALVYSFRTLNEAGQAKVLAYVDDLKSAGKYNRTNGGDELNFIFDVGNVLINYKPMLYLEGLFPEKELQEKMYETVFLSHEWEYMDRGILTHKEAIDIICMREPAFLPTINQTMEHINDLFTPINETVDLLPEIKKAGHSLYYLSNIHEETRDYLLDEYQFFNLFDGGVFSCDVKVIKPSAQIYRHLLDKLRLKPEDCLFFDDVAENVAAAEKEGIKGVLFTGAECVRPFLHSET